MKKMILIIVVALLVIVGGYFCLGCGNGCGNTDNQKPNQPETAVTANNNGCSESCSTSCSADASPPASPTCGGCGQTSCTSNCSTNPANENDSLKTLLPSCSLSNEELIKRKQDLSNSIMTKVSRVEEMETGFDLVFNEPGEYSAELLEFINFERQCCSSFTYGLIFEPGNVTHLQIYGSADIKKELKNGFGELGLLN